MKFFYRLLRMACAALLCASLASCAVTASAVEKPRLVVLLVIDGLPQHQVLDYRDQLSADGFSRFLNRGAWYSDAHHGHAFTVTAAGHAAMLTGAHPNRTGIIANEWRDASTGAPMYNTADPAATYIGHKTDATDGTSPRNLKVETLGDVLRRVHPRSKVISISGKDRGAILTAGKTGTAYMFMDESGEFASSTYYMHEHPDWVRQFNAGKPADRFFKAEWKPLLGDAAYTRSIPDDQPWFGPGGGRLPMVMGAAADDAPGIAFYWSLLASPFIDVLSLNFARAAIAGEKLGADDAPDILAISLSGHDYVNHRWSAESRMSQDHMLRLDRMLESFFRDLDATVGPDNYIALLTADHGFMPAPEYSRAKGVDATRASLSRLLANVSAGMNRRFGDARWVRGFSGSSLLLDRKLIAEKGLDLDRVAEEARRLIMLEPSIAAAYTRRELLAETRAREPLFKAMRRSWHPDVSGEVQYVVKENVMFGSAPATHGSPYPYDTHVPILVYAPKWVKPGRIDGRVEVVDIAPTLANWLHIPAPASSEGRLLPIVAP